VATFKPVYLIHGDDHGRIAERRARLRAIAEAESGTGGVEVFEGDGSSPEAVALALNAMTFAMGRRFLIVDGVERWKDAEAEATLVPVLGDMPPETTVAFFAREDGRAKVPAKLAAAVEKAGGDVVAESMLKPRQLPKWAVGEAAKLGITLDGAAAQVLIRQVGERQQRLLRELEKLALELRDAPTGDAVHIDAEMVQELTAASAERRAWALADALLSGSAATATRTLLAMRAQGERLPGLIYWMGSRVRQAHQIARALDRGESQAQIKSSLRMPPSAADKLISDARRIGAERLEQAICLIADLELASRGGGNGGAHEDTRALVTICEITAQ
jgi:DNA polymerase III subunit delta